MSEWWRSAVLYQIYVRSFQDSDGDGVGDLPGIRSRLPYLRALGVDGVWLTPFYPSPGADHGYDVSDYVDVDPQFGTLADFDALVADAHELGLRIVVDIVPEPHLRPASSGSGTRSPTHPTPIGPATSSARDATAALRTAGRRPSAAPPGRSTRRAASGTCTSSRRRSPTSTGTTPSSARASRTCSASGSTTGWTDSGSTSARRSSRRRTCTRSRSPSPRTPFADWHTGINQPELHDLWRSWRRLARRLRGRADVRRRDRARGSGSPGELLPARRAPARLQLPLPLRGVGRGAAALDDRPDAGRVRRRRRARDLGAREPRRDTTADAVRRRRARRDGAGAGRRVSPARPARDGVRLRGAGARTGGGRPPGRAAPGPDLLPHERRAGRPRRVPGADPVGGRHRPASASRAGRRGSRSRRVGGARASQRRPSPRARRSSCTGLRWRRAATSEALRTGSLRWLDSPPGTLVFERSPDGDTVVCALNLAADALPLPEGEALLASEPGIQGCTPCRLGRLGRGR